MAVEAVTFRKNERAWWNEFHGARGVVGRHLRREAKKVSVVAKGLAGVQTGHLKASIAPGDVRPGVIPAVEVTGDTSYATYHHEGTKPHTYTINGANGPKVVKHPGTDANPYLRAALIIVIK